MKIVFIDETNFTQEINTLRSTSEEKFFHVEKNVSEIIYNIQKSGDEALKHYTLKYDHADIADFKVSDEEINYAMQNVDSSFIDILNKAIYNIKEFHGLQFPKNLQLYRDGLELRQIYTPIERVGIYIPGGNTVYPSTVLMNTIPAKIAGVDNICIATPPDSNRQINNKIIASAQLCGVDTIYKMGGAQAIAAFAYGTQSIKKVYKITGPGNVYVTEAKKQVYGQVDIDMLAGPSEILIIADKDSNPKYIAADLLSQAEHDEQALCILISTSFELAQQVIHEIDWQLNDSINALRAKKALENNGLIYLVSDLNVAFDLSNEIAPEHLEILLPTPEKHIDKINNAGSVFLGEYSPEPVGDYYVGVNHTIPTSGKAKFSSPLSTMDFMKHSNIIHYNKEKFFKDRNTIETFAYMEDFTYHANAISIRTKN
jgi:histidinol dehydrogenase